MISKQKNTVLAYCIVMVIIIAVFASTITAFATEVDTSTKKVVTEGNYPDIVSGEEISYGLVAINASTSIQVEKNTENVTEKTEDNSSLDDEINKKKEKVVKKSNSTKKISTAKKATSKPKKTAIRKTTTKVTATAGNSELGVQIANYAKQFIGNPYRMGGTSLTNGADCSGFTQSVFKHFGINLPRVASAQANVGRYVPFNALQPGDLVFYSNGGKIVHVAIYIGGGKIVHAQTPKHGIGITTYNIMVKVTARRLV